MEGEVTVREILTREYVGVSESDSVAGAVDLMLDAGTVELVVLRGAEPVGMLTPGDALSALAEGVPPDETAVSEVMSGTVPTIEADAPLTRAAGEIADAGVRTLLVTDDDGLVGVVTGRDVVGATATVADRATLSSGAEEGTAVAATSRATPTGSEAEAEYSTQGVCENCGSLARDLNEFNGQLICGNCREV